ncbi:MAG: response regulator transcription factor, partial [Armatimonadetes bacterium]|nr:response regulator transcription factor [Armatimonadota bacterium]
QLIAAKQNFSAEKAQLIAQLETARASATAEMPAEPTMPVRPRKQPTPTKSAEIGADVAKPLVILADTDAKSTDALSLHLEAAGYGVRAVRTVADALQFARTASPAALAIDGTNLPDGDCWQMLSAVKEDAELKEIPVLVFAPGKDKEKAMEMGAAGCFAKPIDKAVLVATIKAAMVKRKQRARLAAASGGAAGTTRRSSLLTTPSA